MYRIFGLLFLLFASFIQVQAQTTTVSGTITDSDSIVWTNATWRVLFVPNPNQSNQCIYQLNNVSICSNTWKNYLDQSGTSDSSTGAISLTLLDNAQITPSGSKWIFTIQSNTSAPATQYLPINITGASVNLTSYLSSNSIVPRIRLGNVVGVYAYNDIELTNQTPGNFYWNNTDAQTRQWQCHGAACSWQGLSGAGNPASPSFAIQFANSGASSFQADPKIVIDPTSDTITTPYLYSSINGTFNTFLQQTTPTSNNGIAISITQCQSLPYACQILAPALYSLVELQPWGGVNGDPQITGPTSSDPIGQFLDTRYGVPQWIFNGAKNFDSRHGSNPTFEMNWTGSPTLTGTFTHPPFGLAVNMNYWMGGHSFYNDKTNSALAQFEYNSWTEIQGGSGFARNANCYGVGDCLLDVSSVVSYGGSSTAGDQGLQDQQVSVITGNKIFGATVASVSVSSDGTTTFNTSSQIENGTQGEGRLLIDLNTVYNTGYINAFSTNGNVDESVTCNGGCDWDGSFGVSTKTLLTSAVQNPVSGTNSFPQTNTILTVTSSTGFVIGNLVCIFDYDYECEKISAIPDGTHITISTDRKPHPVGSYVTTGGLAGYGIEYEADRLSPGNTRGIATVPGFSPDETMRWVIPIMYSIAGNKAFTFQSGNILPGQGGGYTGAAFTQMSGSGGTCTTTISAGVVVSITVSGGSNYPSNANTPPQIIFSGTWTTAPTAHVTEVNPAGGVLTTAQVDNGGTGVVSATCIVQAKNPYDIYDAAKTIQVYNEITGKVDGSKLVTEPFPVTPTVAQAIEEPVYFWQHPSITSYNSGGTYFPTLGGASTAIYGNVCVGILQGSDACISSGSSTNPALYTGYPTTNNAVGYGQYITPIFHNIVGSWRQVFPIQMPPFAPGAGTGSTISGYEPAIISVGCGNINCSKWTSPWWMTTFTGATQQNGWMVNISTDTLYGIFKNLDLSQVKTLNLGNPTMTTAGALASGQMQNWNPYSNTLTQTSWQPDAGVTVSLDATVHDPYGGNQPVWKVVSTGACCTNGISDTVTTSFGLNAVISGNVYILGTPGGQVCANIANSAGNCTVAFVTGQYQHLQLTGIATGGLLNRGSYIFSDSGPQTFWIYNPVAESGSSSSSSSLVNNTATSITSNISVNQLAGSDICSQATGCGTASTLAGSPTAGQFWGYNGTVQLWTTPAGGGNVSNSGTPTVGQYAKWINSTAVQGQTGVPYVDLTGTVPTWNQNTTGTAANLNGTPALPNGTTATTQALGDNTTKLSTDAFVIANAGTRIGHCTIGVFGNGTANILQPGVDDPNYTNFCWNDSGGTFHITEVKCFTDAASNTTTINPQFGLTGTGTVILSAALTCGSSKAWATGTLANTSWLNNTGLSVQMGGTATGTVLDMRVTYTY